MFYTMLFAPCGILFGMANFFMDDTKSQFLKPDLRPQLDIFTRVFGYN